MPGRLLILLIRIYQILVSPLLGPCCRYLPSCSEYTASCIARHGPLAGIRMGLKRIARCHPWGGHGHDPPPLTVGAKKD